MIKLKRLSDKPILLPKKGHSWEATAMYLTVQQYMIMAWYICWYIWSTEQLILPPTEKKDPILTSLGYAVSKDGVHFNRLEQPILSNSLMILVVHGGASQLHKI